GCASYFSSQRGPVLPSPQFENGQSEEAVRVHQAALLGADERLDRRLVEQGTVGLRQHLAHVVAPVAAEPLLEWKRETLLSCDVELGREEARGELAENDFPLAVPGAETVRHAPVRELDDARIEQRRANLERSEHAGAIDLDQDVIDEIAAE